MIPAIFDHRWVHPWRRPAEEKRSVRLSAERAPVAPPPKLEWDLLAEEIIDSAERVRVVSPQPPHEPEPYPDEPFTPVYDYKPLSAADGRAPWRGPYGPDPIVFGPHYPHGEPGDSDQESCATCGVEWHVSAGMTCWNCGRPV